MAITRRDGFKAAAAAALAGTTQLAFAAQDPAQGYGTDPKLTEPKVTWPMTLTTAELAALAAVCAVVLPATDDMPSGVEVGVPAFVDEWVSAPYPVQRTARGSTLSAIAALDVAARAAGHRDFAHAPPAVFDTAWANPVSGPLLRDLVRLLAGGYASSDKGMAAIGYIGNEPRERFEGPPPAVVARFDAFVAGLPS